MKNNIQVKIFVRGKNYAYCTKNPGIRLKLLRMNFGGDETGEVCTGKKIMKSLDIVLVWLCRKGKRICSVIDFYGAHMETSTEL